MGTCVESIPLRHVITGRMRGEHPAKARDCRARARRAGLAEGAAWQGRSPDGQGRSRRWETGGRPSPGVRTQGRGAAGAGGAHPPGTHSRRGARRYSRPRGPHPGPRPLPGPRAAAQENPAPAASSRRPADLPPGRGAWAGAEAVAPGRLRSALRAAVSPSSGSHGGARRGRVASGAVSSLFTRGAGLWKAGRPLAGGTARGDGGVGGWGPRSTPTAVLGPAPRLPGAGNLSHPRLPAAAGCALLLPGAGHPAPRTARRGRGVGTGQPGLPGSAGRGGWEGPGGRLGPRPCRIVETNKQMAGVSGTKSHLCGGCPVLAAAPGGPPRASAARAQAPSPRPPASHRPPATVCRLSGPAGCGGVPAAGCRRSDGICPACSPPLPSSPRPPSPAPPSLSPRGPRPAPGLQGCFWAWAAAGRHVPEGTC